MAQKSGAALQLRIPHTDLSAWSLEVQPVHLGLAQTQFAGSSVGLELIGSLAADQCKDVERIAHHICRRNLRDGHAFFFGELLYTVETLEVVFVAVRGDRQLVEIRLEGCQIVTAQTTRKESAGEA